MVESVTLYYVDVLVMFSSYTYWFMLESVTLYYVDVFVMFSSFYSVVDPYFNAGPDPDPGPDL